MEIPFDKITPQVLKVITCFLKLLFRIKFKLKIGFRRMLQLFVLNLKQIFDRLVMKARGIPWQHGSI